jgi:hypothetical protein
VDDDLTRRAERAALGALVSDQEFAARLDCLEARDFTDPRHRAVFNAVRDLAGTPPVLPAQWRALIAATAGQPVTVGYLDGLADACPDPEHGPAYSAMLIQATLYRLARRRADDLDAQAALLGYEGARITQAGGVGGSQAAGLGAHLAEVARAIRGHTAMLAPASPGPAWPPAAPAGLARAAPFPGTPRTPTPPQPATPEGREELVLSALLQQHAQTRQILAFLPAAAFTSPARQEIFRAVHRLTATGRPVDPLTVRWDLAIYATSTAVTSPHTAPPSPVPDGYIDKLARAVLGGDRSPLRVAHDLTALLNHRDSRRPAPVRQQEDPLPARPANDPGRAQRPGPLPAQAPPPPLNRPSWPAPEARQPSPGQGK